MKHKFLILLIIFFASMLVGCKTEYTDTWIYKYGLQEDNTYKIVQAKANKYSKNPFSDIYIPLTYKGKKITTIGADAFMTNLSFRDERYPNLYVGENIIKIEENAFSGLLIRNIEIKENVEVIEENAFFDCCSCYVFCFAESKPTGWSDDTGLAENRYIFNYFERRTDDMFDYVVLKNNKIVITGAKTTFFSGDIIFPATIDDMEVIRIAGCTLRYMQVGFFTFRAHEVTLPETITVLEYGFLTGLLNLKTIIFSGENRITKIEESAFDLCVKLESFIIKKEVLEIGENAFSKCWEITIYAEAESKPSGWHNDWNPDNRPVVWGYTGE